MKITIEGRDANGMLERIQVEQEGDLNPMLIVCEDVADCAEGAATVELDRPTLEALIGALKGVRCL